MTVQVEAVILESTRSSFELLEQLDSAMVEQLHNNSSIDSGWSPGSSAGDQTSTGCGGHPGSGGNASETSMWEEWTQATSTVGDEVSTSNFLPDLTTPSQFSRLSFQQSDMLSSWMSTFLPLAPASGLISADTVDDHPPTFMHDVGLAHLNLDKLPHEMVEDAADPLPLMYESKTTGVSRQLLRALSPLSPSSPLAIHNGLLNPQGDPWDGCPSASASASASSLQWSTVTTTGHTYSGHSGRSSFFPDHSAVTTIDHLEGISTTPRSFVPKPRHTDIFIGPNGTFESATPGGWTPQLVFDHHGSETKVGSPSLAPMKLMASMREAGEATSCGVYAESQRNGPPAAIGLVNLRAGGQTSTCVTAPAMGSTGTLGGMLAESTMTSPQAAWLGKHRLELVELVDGDADVGTGISPLLKRPKISSVSLPRY